MQNISSFHLFILDIQLISESGEQTDQTHFWPWPPKKNVDHFLIYVDLCQHAKNQAILLICSGDKVD